MPRIDGRKIVTLAITTTTLAIGIGTIYLPYIADKDKIRGLFEEEDMPLQAKQEMEYMKMNEKNNNGEKSNTSSGNSSAGNSSSGKSSAGSMWSNLKRN